MTGALRRDAYVLPGQTVSVRRIYKLLLLMLPGKGVTRKNSLRYRTARRLNEVYGVCIL